jgi:serine/threonine protein kinase
LLAGIPHQPAKFYCASVSLPLNYIHKQQVAFRDLKPENVMIDRDGYQRAMHAALAHNAARAPRFAEQQPYTHKQHMCCCSFVVWPACIFFPSNCMWIRRFF